MNEALLDTDTYSEILKAADPNVTRQATQYRRQHGMFVLSAVTVMEIVYGFQRKQRHRRHEEFLAAVALEQVLPLEPVAAELAGRW